MTCCAETQRRIKVAVWAYAYEVMNDSIVSDAEFDAECALVDLSKTTSDSAMDRWFKNNFNPCTGMWVQNHPNKRGLHTYYTLWKKKGRPMEENCPLCGSNENDVKNLLRSYLCSTGTHFADFIKQKYAKEIAEISVEMGWSK